MNQPLVPPFTRETAIAKVRKAEDVWNSRNPDQVALAYTEESRWRNRSEFINGRDQIICVSETEMEPGTGVPLNQRDLGIYGKSNRRSFRVRVEGRFRAVYRSYGNENWEFDDQGIMHHRHASINDLPIKESERLFRWPQGRRPDDHPGLSDLGL